LEVVVFGKSMIASGLGGLPGTVHFDRHSLPAAGEVGNQVVNKMIILRGVAHDSNVSQFTTIGVQAGCLLPKVSNDLVHYVLSHSHSMVPIATNRGSGARAAPDLLVGDTPRL
jgi:hypothetical protein